MLKTFLKYISMGIMLALYGFGWVLAFVGLGCLGFGNYLKETFGESAQRLLGKEVEQR